MLSIEQLSIHFLRYEGMLARNRLDCLTGVDLAVRRGELVALVGSSGGGKSLLAHALIGLLPRNAVEGGTIKLDGDILSQAERARLRGRRIVLVPQSIAALDPMMRVAHHVRLAAARAGRSDAERAANDSLGRFGLDDVACRSYPHQLSGGMARRVLLAAACVADPEVIVFDEPTNGLDEQSAAYTMREARALADQRQMVVVITHDIPAVLRVADTVAIVRDGATVEIAPAAAFAGQGERLKTAYARKLWAALPANDFLATGMVEAQC